MAETPKTITVPLTITVKVRAARWAEEFGVDIDEVAADVASYYGSSEIVPAHLKEEGTVVAADRLSWAHRGVKSDGQLTVTINLDVVVDPQAWNLNFGTGTTKAAVTRNVRDYWTHDFLPSYLSTAEETGIVSSVRATVRHTPKAKAERAPYPTTGDPTANAPSYLKFRRY